MEQFDIVQQLLVTRKKVYPDRTPDPLRGLLICADCGARLYLQKQPKRQYANLDCYYCATYKRAKEACTNHRLLVPDINKILSNELRFITDMAEKNTDKLAKLLRKNADRNIQTNSSSLIREKEKCEKRIVQIDKMVKRLFEQSVDNSLSQERFLSLSADYDREQRELKEQLVELNAKFSEFDDSEQNIENKPVTVNTAVC